MLIILCYHHRHVSVLIEIDETRHDTLQNKRDQEGSTTIFNEHHDILQNESNEGNTSITQDLE